MNVSQITLAAMLFATPTLAQQSPQPIAVPQDVLQRISIYLQEGGSHNEGFALNKAVLDALQIANQTRDLAAAKASLDQVTKERDALKTPPAPDPAK